MFKKLAKWLAGIIRAELNTVEKDTAGLYAHLTSEIAALREELHSKLYVMHTELHVASDERAAALQAHVTSETAATATAHRNHIEGVTADTLAHIAGDYANLKTHIHDEILKRYDTLVRDAAGAARVMDASKIAMAICDYCNLPSRRFATSRIDGKVVCAKCAAKGQN
jgi:hypothetical protein